MKNFLCILFLLTAVGCGSKSLPPFALEEIPPAMQKAFKAAQPDLKRTSDVIVMQVEHKQFAPASLQLQGLMGNSALNKEQRSIVARAFMTVNTRLQDQLQVQEAAVSAPASGQPAPPAKPVAPPTADTAAAAVAMDHYIRTK